MFVNLFRIYHVNITKYLTNYIYLIYNTYAYLGRVLNISNVFIWNNFSNLNCLREKDNKHPINYLEISISLKKEENIMERYTGPVYKKTRRLRFYVLENGKE